MIPVFYAIAMGVDALAALVFGRLFDKVGVLSMVLVAILSALFAPFVFLGGFYTALVGMALGGVSMGAQESIMRAAVANMSSPERRGTAYGVFNTVYGVLWFAGSALMGVLYDISITYLVVFSMLIQLSSIPFLVFVGKNIKTQE